MVQKPPIPRHKPDIGGEMLKDVESEFPGLAPYTKDINVRYSPSNDGRMLEYYPKGERDSYDPSKDSIEIFNPKTSPLDLAGDIVSHSLAKGKDPALTQYYETFKKSMTPDQQSRLAEQYQWSQKNEGETRPFADWAETSGLPAYFRGYAFRQWPGSDKDGTYTPEQLKMFDDMIGHMRAGKK